MTTPNPNPRRAGLVALADQMRSALCSAGPYVLEAVGGDHPDCIAVTDALQSSSALAVAEERSWLAGWKACQEAAVQECQEAQADTRAIIKTAENGDESKFSLTILAAQKRLTKAISAMKPDDVLDRARAAQAQDGEGGV